MIIGLIGRKGSGKGTIAQLLQEEFGARTYRMSDVLRALLDELHLPQSRKNIIVVSEALRHIFGESLIGSAITKQIRERNDTLVVIDGIRRQADLDGFGDLPITLVNVTAPLDLRYERITKRGENAGETSMTKEEFEELESAPTELSIREVESQAKITIENTGTVDDLREKIKTQLLSQS